MAMIQGKETIWKSLFGLLPNNLTHSEDLGIRFRKLLEKTKLLNKHLQNFLSGNNSQYLNFLEKAIKYL